MAIQDIWVDKPKNAGGRVIRYYDRSTGETTFVNSKVWKKCHFLGPATGNFAAASTTAALGIGSNSDAGDAIVCMCDGFNFTTIRKETSGTALVIQKFSDFPNGALQIALPNTNEAEDVGIDWGGEQNIDITKQGGIEFRMLVTTRPAAATGDVFVGLNNTAITATDTTFAIDKSGNIHVGFRIGNGGALTVESDNDSAVTSVNPSVTESNSNTTGIIYRITWNNRVFKFYRNDVEIGTTTTFTISSGALSSGVLQPLVLVSKKAATITPAVAIDYIAYWQN